MRLGILRANAASVRQAPRAIASKAVGFRGRRGLCGDGRGLWSRGETHRLGRRRWPAARLRGVHACAWRTELSRSERHGWAGHPERRKCPIACVRIGPAILRQPGAAERRRERRVGRTQAPATGNREMHASQRCAELLRPDKLAATAKRGQCDRGQRLVSPARHRPGATIACVQTRSRGMPRQRPVTSAYLAAPDWLTLRNATRRVGAQFGSKPGSTSSTAAPRPMSASRTRTRPLWASAIARTMASPSPAPPAARVRPLSMR